MRGISSRAVKPQSQVPEDQGLQLITNQQGKIGLPGAVSDRLIQIQGV